MEDRAAGGNSDTESDGRLPPKLLPMSGKRAGRVSKHSMCFVSLSAKDKTLITKRYDHVLYILS